LLIERLITALVLGSAVVAAVLFLPTVPAAALLGILWVVGGWEWAGLAAAGPAGRGAYAAGTAALIAAALWTWPPPAAFVDDVLLAAALVWLMAVAGILTYPRLISRPVVWVSGPLLLLPGWLCIPVIHGLEPNGPAVCLALLTIVACADMGAFFTGRAVGRIKLAPRISPGKTWEGVLGGVVLALLAAAVIAPVIDVPARLLLPIAALSSIVSVVGDLTVSMLKRSAGVKDSGRLLPGHGGVLDRIDGLNAALPAFTIGLAAAGLLA
jgi:phosphatidate cytidylyltransferase